MKAFAGCLIWFTMLMSVALLGVGTLVLLSQGQAIIGMVMAVMFMLNVLYVYFARHTIAFSTEVLKCVAGIIQTFPSTVFCAFLSIIMQIGWQGVWIFAAIPVLNQMEQHHQKPQSEEPQNGIVL